MAMILYYNGEGRLGYITPSCQLRKKKMNTIHEHIFMVQCVLDYKRTSVAQCNLEYQGADATRFGMDITTMG